jgi:pimeloyl-ACP methyl ester carboxylesterase
MATASVNGVRLFYELTGGGEVPLVLVHGSRDSHHDWDLVVPSLSRSCRVFTYDRRGHSQSERLSGQGSVPEDVANLAALIEDLRLGPAWVAGNSFGASISLRLAGERPDLLRGLIAHQPPLFSLLADDPPLRQCLSRLGRRWGLWSTGLPRVIMPAPPNSSPKRSRSDPVRGVDCRMSLSRP